MSGAARLFFAVDLPTEARRSLEAALASVPERDRPVRLAPAETWHVTLRFLGPTTPEQLRTVLTVVESVRVPPPFGVRIGGWGAFPRPAAARVFWAGLDDPDHRLARAAADLESIARIAGFPAEDRAFKPHVTLGRLRDPFDLRPFLRSLPPIDVPAIVDEIVLLRSHLGSGPARYEPVHSIPLTPSALPPG